MSQTTIEKPRANYPRVHTRGPIEASTFANALKTLLATIRGFTPAAPLKRFAGLAVRAKGNNYPRVHTRGPIEARCKRSDLDLEGAAIRGFTPAAPLKPRAKRCASSWGPQLSAGSHPRPH